MDNIELPEPTFGNASAYSFLRRLLHLHGGDPTLNRAAVTYDKTAEKTPDGYRLTTAAEEVYRLAEKANSPGYVLRLAARNLAGLNGHNFRALTSTVLRIPPGHENMIYEDNYGRAFVPRVVLKDGEETDEITLPYPRGVINQLTNDDLRRGMPVAVRGSQARIALLNIGSKVPVDDVTGHYDFTVTVGLNYDGQWIPVVEAMYGRHMSYTEYMFRLVEKEKKDIKLRERKIEDALL